MSDTDGKCGVVSDFSAWDGTKFRCLHDFDHPGLPHSWEKHRKQFTIFGGTSAKEVEMGPAMACPCGERHDERSPGWQAAYRLIEKVGANVIVTVEGAGSWEVPRIYIAMHGMKAQELPALAEKYAWKKAA